MPEAAGSNRGGRHATPSSEGTPVAAPKNVAAAPPKPRPLSDEASGEEPDVGAACTGSGASGGAARLGRCWGEGAARCFTIGGDFFGTEEGYPQLLPLPGGFICPISRAVMIEPVVTADGFAYEREQIERWIRERRQQRRPITSPATGLELPSTTLMPLVALQHAIQAFFAQRPELQGARAVARSLREEAAALRADLQRRQVELERLRAQLPTLAELGTDAALDDCGTKVARSCDSRPETSLVAESAPSAATATTGSVGSSVGALPAQAAEAQTGPPSAAPVSTERARSSAGARPALAAEASALAPTTAASQASERQDCQTASAPSSSAAVPPASEALDETAACPNLAASASAAPAQLEMQRPRRAKGCIASVLLVLTGLLLLALTAAVIAQLCLAGSSWQAADGAASLARAAEVSAEPVPSTADLKRSIGLLTVGSPEERLRGAAQLRELLRSGAPAAEVVLQAGAASPLVGLLHGRALAGAGAAAQEAAAAALAAVAAAGGRARAAVARAGAIAPLVRLLRYDHPAGRREAVAALRHLTSGSAREQANAVRAGAASALVPLLGAASSEDLRAEAAGLLGEIAAADGHGRYERQVSACRAGAAEPLTRLLASGEGADVRAAAAIAISRLVANNPDNQVALAQAGAIKSLVNLLRDSSADARPRAAAATALAGLTIAAAGDREIAAEANHGNQEAIVQAGALGPLASLLSDESGDARCAAASALRGLTLRHERNQAAVASLGVVVPDASADDCATDAVI